MHNRVCLSNFKWTVGHLTNQSNSFSLIKNHFFIQTVAAKAVLCGCCGQYGTCSALCDVAAAAHEDCPPKVLSGDNLPKIKEQFFKVNPNGSYEMR